MEKNRSLALLNKINEVLYINKISKAQLSKELGISKSGLSLQLNKLKKGSGISTKTLEAVEKLTGYNFFHFKIRFFCIFNFYLRA